MTTFDDIGLSDRLCEAVKEMGWTEPTPIQLQAIPEGVTGRDMFAQAQTGTGKTGAYALIVLSRIEPGSDTPRAIVLTPTRELADQVSKEMRKLTRVTRHRVVAVYGGASISKQMELLSYGCDIVVGTPGRVIDLYDRGILKLDAIQELVLDEADRMLDMGFIDDMKQIIAMTPDDRQMLMFSATVSDEVRAIMEETMDDPIEVSVSQDELVSDLVTQYWVGVSRLGKQEAMMEILTNGDPKTVIFCSTIRMVDDLHLMLTEQGVRAAPIHGDMSQYKREQTIRSFKTGRVNILIATDVAARGLDIDDIELVLNYDSPTDAETYTHRIGRTGRAGRTGVSITFVTPREDWRVRAYEEYMDRKIERVAKKNLSEIQVANPELKALHANDRFDRRDRYDRRGHGDRQERRGRDGDSMARVVRYRESDGYQRRERGYDDGYGGRGGRHDDAPRDGDADGRPGRDDRRSRPYEERRPRYEGRDRRERPRYDDRREGSDDRHERREGRYDDSPRDDGDRDTTGRDRPYEERRPRYDEDGRRYDDRRGRGERPEWTKSPRDQRKDRRKDAFMDTVTISLDIGKKSVESRTDVLDFITKCSGVRSDSIGHIAVTGKVTFVDVESSQVGRVLNSINSTKFNGKKVNVNFAPQKVKYKDKFGKE